MKRVILISIIAFFAFNSEIFSQDSEKKILKLTVKDKKSNPVPYAVILLDNVRQKRWTNSKGKYTIKVNEFPKTISAFSPKIGINKINYNGENEITIIIKEKKEIEIVSDQNKALDPIQYRDIYDYLRGQVPGVNIANRTITIRGFNSVNGSTTPLFILNNTQVDQDIFSDIVPTTIKSIKVLKGPESATYGSRGANGVIIVTTL